MWLGFITAVTHSHSLRSVPGFSAHIPFQPFNDHTRSSSLYCIHCHGNSTILQPPWLLNFKISCLLCMKWCTRCTYRGCLPKYTSAICHISGYFTEVDLTSNLKTSVALQCSSTLPKTDLPRTIITSWREHTTCSTCCCLPEEVGHGWTL